MNRYTITKVKTEDCTACSGRGAWWNGPFYETCPNCQPMGCPHHGGTWLGKCTDCGEKLRQRG